MGDARRVLVAAVGAAVAVAVRVVAAAAAVSYSETVSRNAEGVSAAVEE